MISIRYKYNHEIDVADKMLTKPISLFANNFYFTAVNNVSPNLI